MNRHIYLISIVMALSSCTNQFNELNTFYVERSYDKFNRENPDLPENRPLYYNEGDKMLITPYSSIPLNEVKMMYYEDETSSSDLIPGFWGKAVIFKCEKDECVIDETLTKGTYMYFGTKEDCIKFMELCDRLRKN